MDYASVFKSLVLGHPDPSISSNASSSGIKTQDDLAKAVVDGRLEEALNSPLSRDILRIHAQCMEEIKEKEFSQLFGSIAVDNAEAPNLEFLRLLVGIACLQAFVQANWTGPPLEYLLSQAISVDSSFGDDLDQIIGLLNSKATSELAAGGEPAYHLTQVPALLRIAQIIFEKPIKPDGSEKEDLERLRIWYHMRCTLVHQQVLDDPVALTPNLVESLSHLLESLSPTSSSSSFFRDDPELRSRLLLERGLLEHQLGRDKDASEYFVKAARETGLEYELTGALGKRTKFQEKELSQLVLLAESQLHFDERKEEDTKDSGQDKNSLDANGAKDVESAIPQTLALNDDTLLEHTQFTSSSVVSSADNSRSSLSSRISPSSQNALHPLDQSMLLALCLNIRNTSPLHGLTNTQMSPYVERVLSHPINWSVHTMGLLLRSRLESGRTRTVERSVLQLQALIDQMPTADSSVSERLRYFYDLALPSKWEMERELGKRYLTLGVTRSALEIFERLEMWEDAVLCYVSLEQSEKAVLIVRDLLEGSKAESDIVLSRGKDAAQKQRTELDKAREAKLYCILGDLAASSSDEALGHYERAWEISSHTSGRAIRSLGSYYFTLASRSESEVGSFTKAIDCLSQAVKINPLVKKTWFILGCALMREERWLEAKDAFASCVRIDEEDGESWANLGAMYLRIASGEKTEKGDIDASEKEVPKAIPFQNRLLAHRALQRALKYANDNWRIWSNYTVVSMDVAEFAEAAKALGRVVELTSAKMGEQSIDIEVLERLVDAVVTKSAYVEPSSEEEKAREIARNPNTGFGLSAYLDALFSTIILPRISSIPRVFKAYAKLLTWRGQWKEAVDAYLDAFRCGKAANMQGDKVDDAQWKEAVGEVEDIIDILQNFGPRVEGFKWKLQARSILRSFMSRTKDFEDLDGWDKLEKMGDDLSSTRE